MTTSAAPTGQVRESKPECGHTAHGNGFTYICDRPEGHRGWHAQHVTLRRTDGPGTFVSTTNWGDDGLATHASKDETRRRESQ